MTDDCHCEAEEFLSWMATERGRSANTLVAYRRDLAWLLRVAVRSDSADVMTATGAQIADFVG